MFGHRIFLTSILVTYTAQVTKKIDDDLIPISSPLFFVYAFIAFALSCFAGVCSGLTVGYMSISKTEMQIWVNSENQYEKKVSKPILSLLENHHLLLSTLLLSNALALEALPIFLDKIVPSYIAIIISTCAVVVFGEVVPQAYCTGKHKISIGFFFAPFIKLLQWLLYIFVTPITYVLDNWLGHHDDKIVLTPENLKNILYLHNNKQYGYRPEEIKILQNTMDLRLKSIESYMIPLENIFMVSEGSIIDAQFVNLLEKYNFSKILVYSKYRSNIVGLLKVKNLLALKPNNLKLSETGIIQAVNQISGSVTLLDGISQLKQKNQNLAVVINETSKKSIGMITLKKIFENLVLEEFKDDENQVQYKWTHADGGIVEGEEQS